MQQRTESADGPGAPSEAGAEQAALLAQAVRIADALALPRPMSIQRRRRIALAAAAALSLLLHAASLYAFLAWRDDAEIGALDRPSDAISVEIVESRTVEAMQPRQAAEPAAAPAATAPVEGKAEASDGEPVPKPERRPEPEISVPRPPLVVPDATEEVMRAVRQETPQKSEVPPAPVAGPAATVPPPPASSDDDDNAAAKQKQPKRPERKKAVERAPKGGVTSRAESGKGRGGERASASSGSMLSYAAHVRARVAGNKPSGGGLRGTAVVAFGVTASGRLAYASVARSSGNAALDGLAVAAVRGAAPFPTPPAGATPGQLRFSIPFHFQ